MTRAPTVLATLALTALASVAGAQERALNWRRIAVEAKLDADGVLHVRERQVMVFTGDWNGGERRFDLRNRQRFDFHRIARVDSASGVEAPLTEGDLSQVDHYDWAEGRTLRWRSRLPSDPPFAGTAIEYVLDYTYSNILVSREGQFVLDHDFAFADRSGDIEQFVLTLTIDPAWRAPESGERQFSGGPLPPGRGFVVTVPLAYVGAGRPAGVDYPAPVPARVALALLLLVGVALMARDRYRRERSLGRFALLAAPESIDETWLREHVFAHRPEVVGAAWDDSTGAAEVTAVLARLVSEKKLASEVRSERRFLVKDDVLALRLLVPREQFGEYERRLIDALFFGGAVETDTTRIRQHYRKSGFDPASKIEAPLKRIVKAMYSRTEKVAKPSARRSRMLLLTAVALCTAAVVNHPADLPVVIAGVGGGLVLYMWAAIAASLWRNRVANLESRALSFLIPVGVLVAGALGLLATGAGATGMLALAGLTAFALALVSSVMNLAGWRESLERMEFRRRLAAARSFFALELGRETPRLRDDWFPYLIAFGLADHMDKWFRAFGGETRRSMLGSSTSFGSSGRSSNGQSWTGFGGGGGFSGGGASASWVAAAGSMAAGVSAPSSSSSGGSSGGGGGGSSGGGGGGGW